MGISELIYIVLLGGCSSYATNPDVSIYDATVTFFSVPLLRPTRCVVAKDSHSRVARKRALCPTNQHLSPELSRLPGGDIREVTHRRARSVQGVCLYDYI